MNQPRSFNVVRVLDEESVRILYFLKCTAMGLTLWLLLLLWMP